MTKKKRFGISQALTRGLSETINVVENNNGMFRHAVLPLSRIELDPDNPRKLSITLNDVRHGIQSDDERYEAKQIEFEKLKELAHTVSTSGVINPIVAYKNGETYRIVAGERRCLASILAGKQEIDARIFHEKPKNFHLKLVQWIENTAREDLTLGERLGNIQDLLKEYKTQQQLSEVNATLLKNITGLSLSQCTYYLAALNAPDDVQKHIQNGAIANLDKAALLSTIASQEVRKLALDACLAGANLKELRNYLQKEKLLKRAKQPDTTHHQGRHTTMIQLGTTHDHQVVKTIVEAVLEKPSFHHYQTVFQSIVWDDKRQSAKAFRKLIELLEKDKRVQT